MSDTASSSRPWQWIGGLGIIYSVLYFIGALALPGSSPSDTASPAKIATYYADHKASLTTGVFTMAAAMVVFVFFLSSLRRAVARSGRDGSYLSMAIVVGGAVYIGGFLLSSMLQLALVEAGKNHADSAAQTLNYLSTDQWVSVALGVLSLAGPLGAIAYLITPLWSLTVGIVLARASGHDLAG